MRPTPFHTVPALVKRAQLAFRGALDDALRAHGISASQYGVLRRLADDPGLSNAELARATFVSAQAMQEQLAALEAAGLVARTDDPDHGRIRRTRLTPLGGRAAAECRAIADQVEARMLSGLDASERATLADLLLRCADALAAEGVR
jgi:DNA-binding MarR family transcriptional regulator